MSKNISEGSLENKVISGMVWRFAERICAQVVTFVVSIILARLLAPSDYGAITMVTVFITIANVFVTSGFGNSLVQKKDADEIDFSTVFYFNIGFSVLIYAIMFFISPVVANFYNIPILCPVLRVLSIKLILAGINSVQNAYVSRHMLFFRFFWSTIIGTVISAIVGIVMAYMGYGVWALVAQYLTNSTIDTLVLWITVKWRPQKVFVFKRLKPLISFGWKLLVDQLLTSVYNNLKSMVIGKIYTSEDLAFYAKGVQFPDMIVNNVNTSISTVLFPAMSKIQDDKSALKRGLQKSIRNSSFFLSPLLIGMFVVAPAMISILLTEKWLPCIPYLRIACTYYLFFPITTANLEVLLAVGRSDLSLKLTIIKRIVAIALIAIAVNIGVWAIAASDLLVVLLATYLNTYYIRKLISYGMIEQLKDFFPSVFSSLIMGGIVYLVGILLQNCSPIIVLLIQTVTGIFTYIVVSWIFNRNDLKYLVGKIQGLIKKIKNKKSQNNQDGSMA